MKATRMDSIASLLLDGDSCVLLGEDRFPGKVGLVDLSLVDVEDEDDVCIIGPLPSLK
jgi:hypothetical protein